MRRNIVKFLATSANTFFAIQFGDSAFAAISVFATCVETPGRAVEEEACIQDSFDLDLACVFLLLALLLVHFPLVLALIHCVIWACAAVPVYSSVNDI